MACPYSTRWPLEVWLVLERQGSAIFILSQGNAPDKSLPLFTASAARQDGAITLPLAYNLLLSCESAAGTSGQKR